MSTWCGAGTGAASAADAKAKAKAKAEARSVRNAVADRGRIGSGRILIALKTQRTMGFRLSCERGTESSQGGGFRGRTLRPIYDRSNPENTPGAPKRPGLSESSTVLN